MSINLINPGLVPNDGTGDPLRVGAIKVNESISELYSILNASVVPAQTNNAGKLLTTNGTSLLWVESFAATNPQADWLAISGPSQILNKPLLSLVATSGSYLDLINRPTVPSNTNQLINGADFAVRSEVTWNALPGKPTFATVATSGSYLDLTNRPNNDIPSQSGNGGRYLTTNGSVLSWSTIVGGGGEGTSINTSRTEFTATANQTVFTGVGTYEIGTGQLRVYIAGVRQFPTAYTETSTTSFTLNSGVAVGTAVLAEVDGYVSAPSVLPTQTGNDGKFLTTNGTLVSWATIPSVYVLPTATTSILGGVKVDGTTITINGSGVISSTGGGSGTVINTSRTVFTATSNQTVFTGVGSYTIGTGQLRVYIAGVRQFPTAYTETSTTSFTLTAGVASGTSVLAEVDGYTGTPELYSLPTATTSILGGVKVDGTTITITNGVISSVGGGGTADLTNVSTNILPAVDNTYDLGSADKRFRHLFVGPGSIYIGDESRSITVTPTSIDLPVGTTIGGEEPLRTTIQNIFNEIINNYLSYEDIPGAPEPIIDVDQLSDLNGRLVTTAITGITYPGNDSSVSTIGNQTVILTGRGFQRACNVYVNNSPVVSTAFINSTSVQFTTTAQDAGTYLITLANPDSTTAVLSPGILYLEPGTPRFTFPSGLFATFSRNTVVSKTLTVTDGIPPYTITISSGTLPSGLTLNTANGVISGTTPNVNFDTVFNFTAQVTDSSAPPLSTTSPYYILVALPIPVELTIGGPGTIGASTLISNRAFFIEYEEDITNAPAITISGTSIISNKTFFIEYEEDITNTPTFTITGTAIRSYDNLTLPPTQRAMFAFGTTGSVTNISNLVSSTGVVATDTTGVGTARQQLAAAGYGGDKAIFGYGTTGAVTNIPGSMTNVSNLVSNTGVIATDTSGVGTARRVLAAAGYGNNKAIFGFGITDSTVVNMTNLVSNTGVIANDTTGVNTGRTRLAASSYGIDKAIFGYGENAAASNVNLSNLVSNTGVIASDTSIVGTARQTLAAAGYGIDKAIFGYGSTGTFVNLTNLVSNTGVVASDTVTVGATRASLAAAGYGGDKAIFAYGVSGGVTNISSLVSSTGVVATDTTGVGTARQSPAAAGYSSTASPDPTPTPTATQRAIFGFGNINPQGGTTAITNLVTNTGVVGNDVAGVGKVRQSLAAAGYGGDKAIFGYGNPGIIDNTTNLVSNTGVVATDTTGVGTARMQLAASSYGGDKAIFGYGATSVDPYTSSLTNLVSNTGVVATDTTGVGTARSFLASATFGSTGQAIFAYGDNTAGANVNISNRVSNTGVVATDTTGVGTARSELAATNYGGDKAIFGYGTTGSTESNVSLTNLVSNTGVVATDTSGVGTARLGLAAAGYGGDKAIFGYGLIVSSRVSMTNLVSNTGVVATDTAGVGTARNGLAAAGYSST